MSPPFFDSRGLWRSLLGRGREASNILEEANEAADMRIILEQNTAFPRDLVVAKRGQA